MSSDTNDKGNSSRLDRITKLWISIWTLVLEDKRHLETICATLQRAVFHMKGIPGFKNWKAICEIGRTDPLLMMVLATLDMSKADHPMNAGIISAFPYCFSTVKCGNGPYPLSVIRAKAEENKRAEEGHSYRPGPGANFPISNNAIPDDVPIITLNTGRASEVYGKGYGGILLPEELREFKNAEQGQKIVWGGREFVLMENNDSTYEIYLAPAECIVLDL